MNEPSAFRSVPRTGVIFVTTEATRRGYHPNDPQWCNLGQGQPETSALPGAPPRIKSVSIDPTELEYAPVAGLWELREAVAGMYNHFYRRGLRSQYSAENVAISGGGRVALTRVAASLGSINLGHFLPDYTAYEELLDIFRAFTAIPMLLEPDRGYAIDMADLRREVLGRGLSALLLSNPSNPTGKLVGGDELGALVRMARALDCTMVLDEFYSHYVWAPAGGELGMESAARHVEDVDQDPVVILDGLTKNWRYPGWRLAWTVGPKSMIEAVTSAGSFLDGGGTRPLQRAAADLLAPTLVEDESRAIGRAFRNKREWILARLRGLGVRFDAEPEGTFYAWGDVSGLPGALADGMGLFERALDERVIVVPGAFFDVNPGQRRTRPSRFSSYVRFSFGPSADVLERACDRLERLVRAEAR